MLLSLFIFFVPNRVLKVPREVPELLENQESKEALGRMVTLAPWETSDLLVNPDLSVFSGKMVL